MGSTVQMYASANPSDSMCSIDCQGNGKLIGVEWTVICTGVASADFLFNAQLSFSSTGQQTTNDTRSVVSNCGLAADITTQGQVDIMANKYVALPDIDVGMGERLYIHGAGTATTLTIRAVLHFSFDFSKPSNRRA